MVYLRLEGLKISDALISTILHSYLDIYFFILDKSKGFTNIPIIEIVRFSLKLQHLSLNSSIEEILCNYTNLKYLGLEGCKEISEE
ncbi:3135_t:CDS:2, partial [Dentiscutata heterogama]